MDRIKILGVLLFNDFELLDVAGPLEMFGNLPGKIKIILVAEKKGLVKSVQGVSIMAEVDLEEAPPIDILLIPGGMGTRKEVANQKLLNWINVRSKQSEIILSVCTGAALLAKAHVLDNLRATSNKIAFNWVIEQGPNVSWVKHARWVDAGKIITSSGVAAGIDMSLYLIGRLYGKEVQNDLIKRTEYIFNDDANNDPFSKN